VTTWVDAFAVRLGVDPPDAGTVDAILRLAAEAAHGSARQAAPVACWLAATAGIDPEAAERLAAATSEALQHD
jgi:hypothetical protein